MQRIIAASAVEKSFIYQGVHTPPYCFADAEQLKVVGSLYLGSKTTDGTAELQPRAQTLDLKTLKIKILVNIPLIRVDCTQVHHAHCHRGLAHPPLPRISPPKPGLAWPKQSVGFAAQLR